MQKYSQFIITVIAFILPNLVCAQILKEDIKQPFHGCATDVLQHNNPSLRQAQNALDADLYHLLEQQNFQQNKGINAVYTIPVVIHIVHNNGAENISNVQAQTAITHLNAAFQQNGNARIQFCLAQRDPQGNPTTGITRDVSPLTNMTVETQEIGRAHV